MKKLIYIFVCFVMPNLLSALQVRADFLCNGKKVGIIKTQHNCVVKFERQLADFYLDGELVQEWVKNNLGSREGNYSDIDDTAAYEKLWNMKMGDTIVIESLEHHGLAEIIEINLKDLFQKNTTVEMQIYDKMENEFVTKVHCKEFEAKSSHGGKGKRFSLFNAKHHHDKWDCFFNMFYDFKGGW